MLYSIDFEQFSLTKLNLFKTKTIIDNNIDVMSIIFQWVEQR